MNLSHFPQTPKEDQREQIKELIRPFPVVRFMNWQQTNHFTWAKDRIPVQSFSELPQPDDDWVYKTGPWQDWPGVPLQVLIDLANEVESRPWFCIPHGASDEMIAEMVDFIVDGADYRPILEFSNEIWNSMFSQRNHCFAECHKERDDLDDQSAALMWQARQTKLIAEAAAGRADVVVAGQFFNEVVADFLLKQCGDVIDALAVAPYPGRKQRAIPQSEKRSVRRTPRRSMQDIADELEEEITGEVADLFRSYKAKCDEYGIELFAYEGGLHQVARNDGDEKLFSAEKRTFAKFNQSEAAGEMTQLLWQTWQDNGGTVFCPYSLCTAFYVEWSQKYDNTFFGHCEIVKSGIKPLPKYDGALAVASNLALPLVSAESRPEPETPVLEEKPIVGPKEKPEAEDDGDWRDDWKVNFN